MKKIVLAISCLVLALFGANAQDLNSGADEILGEYFVAHEGENSRIRIFKEEDGTYKAQVFWVENDLDKKGNKRLDAKNPDKSLRNTPCDEIVIIWGVRYNAKDKCWDGGKVYDATRGMKANAKCWFETATRLKLKGTVGPVSKTVVWIKEK